MGMPRSAMVGVTAEFTGAASREEPFDGAAVFTAEIVEISDVVVGLVAKAGHVVLHTQGAGLAVTIQGARKIVEADETHGHVVEGDGHVLPGFVGGKGMIGALVIVQGLVEAILAVKNVANVIVEAGEPVVFA